MRARRRAGPAAIAAALIGVGLALYRPARVPELRAGPRVIPSAPALAATIMWPPAPTSTPAGVAGGPADPHRAGKDEKWRDAPANLPRIPADSATLGSRVASTGARHDQALRTAPSSAETDHTPEPRSHIHQAPSSHQDHTPSASVPDGSTRASSRTPARRVPIARGPADPAVSDEPDADAGASVAARTGEERPNAAAWTRHRTPVFPLFDPPHRTMVRIQNAGGRRRVRPLLLSKLLGRGALRPPPASIITPDLSSLRGRRPLLMPDGSPVPTRAYELDRIESQDPRHAGSAVDHRRQPHWDAGPLWHDGSARGIISDARWLWLWKDQARWWAVREPQEPPLLRHQGLWWSKERGVWFALHEGELWSWRRFSKWDAEGLIRLADGVELVYSADFTKVAVITPGAGAVLYDANTGAELGHWLESELPHRRPHAPADLRLPRGI